ncbi:hypothetical protein RIF25_09010 [Thermosynechococcaceae cyanobacterium BACA0444]|uniref:Uncharacterized protein n=1 Tax=Pseudocalidococcus azoricus BACA0444 TaxID=2918990 RepID=A0AAE4JZL1_9CYAN|nr:hypothetical protein [Pseudocalidococcus azoricus]MDS3860952.1 hypothetical protein [Pseudocalidococcus azoricus BACA0444]
MGILFGINWLSMGQAWGQSIPRIKTGVMYPQVRQELLSRGWILLPNASLLESPTLTPLERYLINQQGYSELYGCEISGVDLCAFRFQNRRGEILEISTVHLSVTPDGTILSWTRRKLQK